jgi:hypothetical protein
MKFGIATCGCMALAFPYGHMYYEMVDHKDDSDDGFLTVGEYETYQELETGDLKSALHLLQRMNDFLKQNPL